MKRKFLLLVCLVMIVALVSTSCDLLNTIPGFSDQNDQNDNNDQDNNNDNDETCEHTYSAKWSSNSTEHWHAATCEHAELKSDVAAHVDAGEDGKCDVCSYEIGHTHTYEDVWTSDDTHHWKNATCTHNGEKGELAAHVDANSDGKCDVCTAHVHVVDIYGKCTVCGEQVSSPDVTKIEVILPVILGNANKVTGGNIKYENVNTSVAEKSVMSSAQNVDFILGNGAAYYKVVSYACSEGYEYDGTPYKYEYTNSQEAWYELLADSSVVGVYRTEFDGEVSDFYLDANPLPDLINGYYFVVSTLADAYGAENILNTLYNLSQSDAASEYVYNYEEGLYSFSFNYLYINSDTAEGEGDHVDYYEVEVSFKVSDSGTLTALNIACDCYTNSLDDEEDNDYTYDQNSKTITMKDTAVADTYVFEITQTEGERTYVAEYTQSDFIPESFDAFVDEECTLPLESEITVKVGEVLNIYFGNCAPAGTNVAYIIDSLIFEYVGEEFTVWCDTYGNNANVYSYIAGTYDVTITLGNETFTFTLTVEEEEVVGPGEQPENTVAVTITDTYAWFDLATFTATADGDYTFYIESGIYLGAMGENDAEPWADPNITDWSTNLPVGGSETVSLKAGESYSFYVLAFEKNITVYIPYTVSEYTGSGTEDGGDDDEGVATTIVGGTYIGTGRSGTCTLIIDTDASTVTMNGYVYSYTFADGIVTVYINGNAMSDTILGVTLGSDGVPTSFVSNGDLYTVTEGGNGGDDTEITVVQGTYIGSDNFGASPLTVVIDGNTVTFNYNHPMMGPSSITATYEVVDGAVVLYDEDGSVLSPLACVLVINAEGVPVSADYNGTSYTLSADEGGSDTPVVDEVLDTICGYYAMDGYEVIIYGGADYDGKYFFNAFNEQYDIYYGVTYVENDDGTYTLVLTLDEYTEDEFGFLSEEFIATVDGEYVSITGPSVEVEVIDYPDITLGSTNVNVTAEDIESGAIYYDFVVSEFGYYSITTDNESLYGSFFTTSRDYLGMNGAILSPGTYYVQLTTWEATSGTYSVTLSYSEISDLTEDELKSTMRGGYTLGANELYIYGGESYDGEYIFNVYTSDYVTDIYYLFTATYNEDGTVSIALTLYTENSTEDAFELVGKNIIATYNDGWTFAIEGETSCEHEYVDGVCTLCGEACEHEYVDGVCTVCGEACVHEYEENTFYHPAMQSATCVAPGVAVFECIHCRDYYTEETPIDPEAHDFLGGEEEVITPANCATQTNGILKVTCANEGCSATDEIEIFYSEAHDWDVQKEIYATCTEDGEYYAVCKICGEVESYTYYAEGHYAWGLACGSTGECAACGETFTLEHNTAMSPATCTQAAYCMNCWDYVGEPLGHNFVDGVCTVCGESENGESGDEDIELGENEFTVTTTETYDMYMTDLYTFTAEAAGQYTFYIPAGLGLWSVASQEANPYGAPEVDYYGNTDGAQLTVELAEGEEYSFYVAATTKDDWVISYTCE